MFCDSRGAMTTDKRIYTKPKIQSLGGVKMKCSLCGKDKVHLFTPPFEIYDIVKEEPLTGKMCKRCVINTLEEYNERLFKEN